MSETRAVPHDVDAEAALLRSIIADNRIMGEVADLARPEHFYRGAYRLLYEAALYLANRGATIGVVTLSAELSRRGQLDAAGGAEGVTSINHGAGSPAAWKNYAEIILEKARLRAVIDLTERAAREAAEANTADDADAILDSLESAIMLIRGFGSTGRPRRAWSEILGASFKRVESFAAKKGIANGIPSGLVDLDRIIGGFRDSELSVIAGRPSMGKSTLATNIALHAALEHGKAVAIFSFETDPEQVGMNFLSMLTPADSHKMRMGTLSRDTWAQFSSVGEKLDPLKFEIPDVAGFDPQKIRSYCRACKARPWGLDLVIVDYIGLVRPPRDAENNRQQQVSAISRALKELASELKIPVIALSQLNRASDARGEHRPTLSDLRESGAIEQDADVVMLIYRDEYYNPKTTKKGIAEVIVAKHRNGPVGTVGLAWHAEYLRFANLAVPYEPEEE